MATQIAKLHVEKEYAVVGSWEDTNITLAVLEAYIPRFFTDATNQYYCRSTLPPSLSPPLFLMHIFHVVCVQRIRRSL